MPTAAPTLPPPLREGDRLSREEFLRRWEAMPDLKHAELIDGVVYMPSPVLSSHDKYHTLLHGWLFRYTEATPACSTGLEGTWLMAPDAAPQPDITLRLDPEYGGQSKDVSGYFTGAPELVLEISGASLSRDLGVKSNLYLRAGVKEYLVINVRNGTPIWREAVDGRYRKLPTRHGILRSRAFPGLWLNVQALAKLEWPSLRATLDQGLASTDHAAFVKHLTHSRRDT